MNHRSYKGSQTIEMAVILPIVLLTIVGIIYLCFYVHDATKMKAAAYSTAIGFSYGEKQKDNTVENVITFLYKNKTASVEKNKKSKVEYSGYGKIPFLMLDKMLERKRMVQSVQAENRLNVSYLYVMRVLNKFLTED